LHSDKERYSPEIGCINTELRKCLESMFKKGMTWTNYGTYWHLDHHYPLSKAFEYSTEAYTKALHYTNIRPIKAGDNLKKHNQIPKEFRDIKVFLKSVVLPTESPQPLPVPRPSIWD
jgi:hypothetical protein